MPDIARKLLALPLDTESGEKQMIRLIEQDPQLSAKIVGLANSPIVGVGRKVSSIQDAAMLLGLKKLKSVSIGMATMSQLVNQPPTKNFDPQDLWLHSMTIAIVMNALSRSMPQPMQPDENKIFLSGLLHDIGLMALHHLNAQASDELHHQLRLQPKRPINEIEMELFGITHGQLGARLVRQWNLPAEIIEVVELHHSPYSATANPLVRLVHLAEKLLPNFGVAEHTDIAVEDSEWRELLIDPACAEQHCALVNELAMQVVQSSEELAASSQPKESLIDAGLALSQRERELNQCLPKAPALSSTQATNSHFSHNLFAIIFVPMRAMARWLASWWR